MFITFLGSQDQRFKSHDEQGTGKISAETFIQADIDYRQHTFINTFIQTFEPARSAPRPSFRCNHTIFTYVKVQCVCIYIYIYVYICTHIHMCIYIYVYTHTYIYIYMYTYTYIYIYIYIYIYLCITSDLHEGTFMCTCMSVPSYRYVHTCTHINPHLG